MIYFDNSATTRLSEAVKAKMTEAMEKYGNPSSLHALGLEAEKLKEEARSSVLGAVYCGKKPNPNDRLIFTSSGTEANNLAVLGSFLSKESNRGKKAITTDSEHPSVLECYRQLEKKGVEVIYLPTKNGYVDVEKALGYVDRNTFLVSVMLVNNETGARYDVEKLFMGVKRIDPKITTHTDCVQAFLKTRFDPRSLRADLITVSSHKIHGPKGAGALYISEETFRNKRVVPVVYGGGQEGGFRSGTENTVGIAGFGEAAKAGENSVRLYETRVEGLKNRIISAIKDSVRINEPQSERKAHNIINFTLPGIRSETMLHYLSSEGVCVSSGSACSSNHKTEGSAVLRAFGLSKDDSDSSIRVSLCADNTEAECEIFASVLKKGIEKLIRR